MARVPPFDRPATYEDLADLADNVVGEIVGGELHATPRPAVRHLRAASALGLLLGPPFWQGRGGPGGWWILDEPELHFDPDVLVPDLAGWRRSRLPSLPDAAFLSLPPDWVCEILSPSTEAFDRAKKLAIYARESVPCAWLIDPGVRTLEVLELEDGRWATVETRAGNEAVRVPPFADVAIRLSELWGED